MGAPRGDSAVWNRRTAIRDMADQSKIAAFGVRDFRVGRQIAGYKTYKTWFCRF
jgi:hypothetical protein